MACLVWSSKGGCTCGKIASRGCASSCVCRGGDGPCWRQAFPWRSFIASYATSSGVIRNAALSDIHYSKSSQGSLQSLFNQIAESADVLLLCGDLTDYGLAEEARANP